MFSASPRRPSIVTLFSLLCWCACLGALFVGMLGLSTYVAPDYWVTDNMSFFLTQFLAAGLFGCVVGALGLLVRHRFALLYRTLWSLAFIAFVSLAGLTGSRTLAHTADLTPATDSGRKIKVVSINIEHLFLGDEVLRAFLEKEQPEIVVIEEALWWLQERRWERFGLPIGGNGSNGFPEYLKVGELGGLAVYSRFPILASQDHLVSGTLPPGSDVYYDADRELLSLTLDTGDRPLHLLAIHPDSPRTHSRWVNKRAYMDELDKVLTGFDQTRDRGIIAIGDWNSSPWSARFQRTLNENGLVTAYTGGWPQNSRFFFDYRLRWFLGSPVDQFAVSRDIQVENVSLGPDIGSDHVPLIVEIGLPASEQVQTSD
ncbi:endonuclease/exonuclease/phosphatase family protein [Rhodobacterales bacterium]|nr:endonuclease/exonuclease/phosphatase family protein [Rhodobacterales bacterium]